MAATIAAPRSAPVEVTTRAVNVEALKPWSIVRIMYCSIALACRWARLPTREHVEVVGRRAQVVPRLERLLPLPEPVRRGQDGRDDRAEPEGLVRQLVGVDVVRRSPTELRPQQRDRGAQHVERRTPLRQRREQGGQTRRHDPSAVGPPPRTPPRPPLRGARRGTTGARRPRAISIRQIHGGVLPVVEEALLPAHVADRGLGHDDAFEPGRDVDARLGGGTDAGHSHQVAERHHTDAHVAVDHREMAVVVRGEAGPGGVDPLVGTEHVGLGRHPEPNRLPAGVGQAAAARRRSRSVRMPATLPPSVTTTDPVSARCISRAASASVSPGPAGHCRGGHQVSHDRLHEDHSARSSGVCKY